MLARSENVLLRHARADRHAARKPFGKSDDVGADAVNLRRRKLARAIYAALHLVGDQKQLFLFQNSRESLHASLIQRLDTSLALD